MGKTERRRKERGLKGKKGRNGKHGKTNRLDKTLSTRFIKPTYGRIFVSRHAVRRLQKRSWDVSEESAKEWIRRCIIHGRRSDRDFGLVKELGDLLKNFSWVHDNRPLTLFKINTKPFVVVACAANEVTYDIAAITCFDIRCDEDWRR
jgi:hypothetical protein